MAVNHYVAIGRLTRDVELRKTESGKSVTNFTLAVDKPYSKENEHPEANWIDCVAWDKRAEFLAKYFSKGNKVAVTGSLQTRKYKNKDSADIKVTEVLVDTIDFVESKASKSSENSGDVTENKGETPKEYEIIGSSSDDVPF